MMRAILQNVPIVRGVPIYLIYRDGITELVR